MVVPQKVQDAVDNQQDGYADCDEVLYVMKLIVNAGAVLHTDGCRVYYQGLVNEGSIPGLGTDVLQICFDEDGDGKVTICHHATWASFEKAHTIEVNIDELPAHFAHGDYCGPCYR